MDQQNNNPQEESAKNIEMPVTLKEVSEATNISSSGIMISGAALRQKYVYLKRDEYINEFDEVPTAEIMSVFKGEAKNLYPKDGDYVVRDGVAMYLGIA